MGRPGYRALQRVPSVFLTQKRTALHGFCPVKQSFLYLKTSRSSPRSAVFCICHSAESLPAARLFLQETSAAAVVCFCLFHEKTAQPSPQAWLSCKTQKQFLKLCAERSGAHLKSFCLWKNKVTPALPAIPARSRCSGICRWSSAQRSGHTPLQCRRCSGDSCNARCSPDAWGAWAAPCGQPCRSQ